MPPPRDAIRPPPVNAGSIGREIGGALRAVDRFLCGDSMPTLAELEAEEQRAALAADPNTITVDAEPPAVSACLTCAGAGSLGAPGHQVQCPVCGGGGLQR